MSTCEKKMQLMQFNFLQSLAPESKPSSKRPLQSYTLDVVYIDEALVMNSMVALPLVHKCLASSMALVEGDFHFCLSGLVECHSLLKKCSLFFFCCCFCKFMVKSASY